MKLRRARLWQRLINGASLIGVLVAVGAAILAYSSAEHGVRAQYVAVAAGILNVPKGQSDADLRFWATKALKKYSEIPLPEKVIAGLNSGKITLSGEDNGA